MYKKKNLFNEGINETIILNQNIETSPPKAGGNGYCGSGRLRLAHWLHLQMAQLGADDGMLLLLLQDFLVQPDNLVRQLARELFVLGVLKRQIPN